MHESFPVSAQQIGRGGVIITRSQFRYSRKQQLLTGLSLLFTLVVLLAIVGLPSKVASAAREYRYGGIDSLVESIRFYDYPWASPSIGWQSAQPESMGIDGSKLALLKDRLEERGTRAFLVVRGNRIVYEWYAPGYDVNRRQGIAGVAKGVTASVALMVALNDSRLSLDDPAWRYIPQWKDDPVRSRITIRHLVTHSSGIKNVPWGRGFELHGWEQDFAQNREERFSMSFSDAPMIFPPGTGYAYSSVGYYPLAYALTASLNGAPQSDIRALLKERVMDSIGVPPSAWSFSYGESYEMDGMRLYATAGGSYTARAVGRIGQLMLNRGEWDGQQLVDPEWTEVVTSYGGSPPYRVMGEIEPASGLGWFINYDGFFPSLPPDAFLSAGANQEVLLVVPSLELVMVRLGRPLTAPPSYPEPRFWDELEAYVFSPLMDSIIQP